MSVYTTADESNTELINHIEKGVKHCNIILDKDTWGSSEYNVNYLRRIDNTRTVLQNLLFDLKYP